MNSALGYSSAQDTDIDSDVIYLSVTGGKEVTAEAAALQGRLVNRGVRTAGLERRDEVRQRKAKIKKNSARHG